MQYTYHNLSTGNRSKLFKLAGSHTVSVSRVDTFLLC